VTNVTQAEYHYIDVFRVIRSAGRSDVAKARAVAQFVADEVYSAIEQARAEAIEQAWDKARGTNADLCKTPLQTYRLMLDAIRSLSAAQEG
jgi:hypothetical protein